MAYKILVFGASYGSLLATKMAGAGHSVKLVCRSATAHLINTEGVRVRFPASDTGTPIEVDSRRLRGSLSAITPAEVHDIDYDLVVLAMQEPQYRAVEVRALLGKVARAKVPCLSIMNMPPLPYLARIPRIQTDSLHSAYSDASLWFEFEPALITLCSPDAQAFRPADEKPNVLQVRLATNFKSAPFESTAYNNVLRRLENDVESARFSVGQHEVELPVKLKVYDSLFVPFAKWSMLLAGNYRCLQKDGTRSIAAAVFDDIDKTRAVYEWVGQVCRQLGAKDEDLVAFDRYSKAAQALTAPSSAARALSAGASDVERVDRLVQGVAANIGMRSEEVDRTVAVIDSWLIANRQRHAGAGSLQQPVIA